MKFASAALVLLSCACSSSMQNGNPDDILLSVGGLPASPGDSVTLTLNNSSAGDIGYNLCASGLERESFGGWEALESDRVCTMELRTLPAGQQTTYTTALPDGLTPGVYRFHTTVELLDTRSRVAVRTEGFAIGS